MALMARVKIISTLFTVSSSERLQTVYRESDLLYQLSSVFLIYRIITEAIVAFKIQVKNSVCMLDLVI